MPPIVPPPLHLLAVTPKTGKGVAKEMGQGSKGRRKHSNHNN